MVKITVNEVDYLVPLDTMLVGQSFFVPTLTPEKVSEACRKVRTRDKLLGRFKVRERIEQGMLGARVWRLA